MNIAIVVVHNKTQKENYNQIEFLKQYLVKIIDHHTVTNEDGSIFEYDTYHYEINDLQGVNVKIYQVLPFQPDNISDPYEGVWPTNANDIDSHKVAYGKDNQEMTGDHPRFFNWGLKRGTDYGADIVVYLDDYKKLNTLELQTSLELISNKNNNIGFIEKQSNLISSAKLIKEKIQIEENKNKTQGISELKQRLMEKGINYG